MLNIKNKKSFAAFLGGLLIFAASASGVSAQVCKKKSGFPAMPDLFATFDTGSPQCRSAKEAFDAAVVIVTGKPQYRFAADYGKFLQSSDYVWVNNLASDPKYSAKFNEGLGFGDAVRYLKERIATNANDRAFAIDNAYWEVYGRDSNSVEQAQWDAKVREQKAWYAVIVSSEIEKLNSDPNRRKVVIGDVIQRAMGRTSNGKDEAVWMSRTGHYRLLMNAARSYLYSSDGAAELNNMLRVAYLAKHGTDPTDAQLKTARLRVADEKLIFEEIMNPKISLK